jgi:hypothetical protein
MPPPNRPLSNPSQTPLPPLHRTQALIPSQHPLLHPLHQPPNTLHIPLLILATRHQIRRLPIRAIRIPHHLQTPLHPRMLLLPPPRKIPLHPRLDTPHFEPCESLFSLRGARDAQAVDPEGVQGVGELLVALAQCDARGAAAVVAGVAGGPGGWGLGGGDGAGEGGAPEELAGCGWAGWGVGEG